MKKWDFKDPDETADYDIDWLGTADSPARLYGESDTIASSVWIVPEGLVQVNDTNTTTHTTIWLSGGTIGETYVLTNRVTTAAGRIYDQSVKLKIKAR